MYIKRKAQDCQISFGSNLKGLVPHRKWAGSLFITPTTTSVAQVKSAKYATLNERQNVMFQKIVYTTDGSFSNNILTLSHLSLYFT